MGKFLDVLESRFRDYRDRDDSDEEATYDYMNPLSRDDQEESPGNNELGSHNQIPGENEPTQEPEPPVEEPEPPVEEPEPPVEEPVAPGGDNNGVDAYEELEKIKTVDRARYDTISMINKHFAR